MKTKRKNIFKSLLALTLALIMVLGVAPLNALAGVDWASLFAPKAEAEGKLDCLEDMPLISESHYTGNQGDSCVFNLNRKGLPGIDKKYYRNGNVGIDGAVYNNGFEVWIARWNFGDNISWASATFDIGGKYKTLTGKSSVIKGSTNTTSYDTSVYFYNGETLLYSFRMTPDDYEKSFKVDVTGVSNLTVMVKDNKEAAGGTSFALYDLFFDNSYGDGEPPIIPSTAVEFNGHYYQVYDNSMTWTEAKEYCEKLGGHLVTITSIEENNYIKDLVVSNGKKNAYWLGASDSETEGVWKWVTGEPFEFSDWGTDEPNQDGEENYLELLVNAINYSLKWNDSNLNGGGGMVSLQNHGFICEWDEIPESGGSMSDEEMNKYITEHINFHESKFDSFESNNGFYDLIWSDEKGRRLLPFKIWDIVGDVGEVATFKFDDLTISADYYELFLADFMMLINNKEVSKEIDYGVLKVGDDIYSGIKKALKSTDEWEKEINGIGSVEVEVKGFFTDPDYEISDKTRNILEKVLKEGFDKHEKEIDKVFSGLNLSSDIFGAIQDTTDIVSAFKDAQNAYQVALSYKNANEEVFNILYAAAEKMKETNPKHAKWFKESLDSYREKALNDDAIYSYTKSLAADLGWR